MDIRDEIKLRNSLWEDIPRKNFRIKIWNNFTCLSQFEIKKVWSIDIPNNITRKK